MKKYTLIVGLFLILNLPFVSPLTFASDAENIAYIQRGVGKIMGSLIAIPKDMIIDSQRIMFPFGIVTGALRGTFDMLMGTLGGAFDAARGAAPYAKYLVFV